MHLGMLPPDQCIILPVPVLQLPGKILLDPHHHNIVEVRGLQNIQHRRVVALQRRYRRVPAKAAEQRRFLIQQHGEIA